MRMQDLAAPSGATGQTTVPRARRLLRGLLAATGLASLTALVFAGALAVTMPASFVGSLVALPPQVEGLSGSAWRGRASLAGGHALSWQVSGRDLWRLRVLADATLEGADTQLSGRLAATPWQVAALDWMGRAGPGLLALAPRVAVEGCTSRAVVEVARLALGRSWAAAEGRVGVGEGACSTRDGAAVPVPAMTLDLLTEGRDARAVLRAAQGPVLATLGVTGDRTVQVRVEPEGAALVPGMPSSAATMLEYPF